MLIRMIKRLFQSILILLCILIPTISISETIKSVGVNPLSIKNGTDSLSISKSVFEPGENIFLSFTASKDYPDQSWIGIFNAELVHDGMANNNNKELAYHYLKKSPEGTFTYTAPPKEGAYDFRMFDRGSGKEVATLNFTVSVNTAAASLKLPKKVFEPGEDITLSFTASPDYPDQSWIGMFKSDLPHDGMASNNDHELAFQYLKKSSKGNFIFTAPTDEGDYDFRMFERSNGKEVATTKYTVMVNKDVASLSLPQKVYKPETKVVVSFTASPHYPDQSWIGMFNADLPHDGMANNNNKELAFHYLKKSPEGTFTYTAPTKESAYDFRMFERSSGKEVATINFTVNKNHRIQDKSVKNNSLTRLDTSGVDGIVDIKPTEDETTAKPSEEMIKPSGTKTTSITNQQNKSNSKSVKKVTDKVLPSETQDIDNNQSSEILFDGVLGKQWKELAAYGGDFKKFAKIEDKVLLVDVPQGNSWGKTGIRSTEALFKIPEKDDKLSEKLTFTFDPVRSSDYILAIIPSNWDGNLEWRSHYIRVGLQRDEENKNSLLKLWINKEEMMKVNLDPESIEQLSIVMRPDRLVLVTDGSDNILLQGFIPENRPIYKDGYKVSVLTHAPKKDMSATLALKTITLEQAPYEQMADLSVVQDKPQKYVLFDGKILGQRWKRYVDAKVTFDDTARISNGALYVDVPKKSGNANVGIESNEPVIWLDQFGKDSKRQVLFRFTPEQTTGFAIALSNKGNHFIVKWFKDSEKGKAFIQIYQTNNLGLISNWNSTYKPVWEKEVDNTAPSEVKLTLTPEGITLSGDQLPEHLQTWSQLQANSGYFIYTYSFPAIPDKAVKMALKEISLDNEVFSPDMPTKPALGVDPLPVIELFSGNKREGWELTPWQIYKKPVNACHLTEKGFTVSSVPEDTPLAGCDIHPDKQIVDIDKRIESTNYQLSAYFDPQKTKNFRISVTPHKRHNWNKYYEACYLDLLQSETRQNIFSFNCGAKKLWQRTVTTEWLKQKWSGRVNILIGKSGMQAELENGVKIHIPSTRSGELYIYFVAPDANQQKNSAEFLLTKLIGQWIAPEGMTVLDRWNYIDEQDFNPEQYLKNLKDELRK